MAKENSFKNTSVWWITPPVAWWEVSRRIPGQWWSSCCTTTSSSVLSQRQRFLSSKADIRLFSEQSNILILNLHINSVKVVMVCFHGNMLYSGKTGASEYQMLTGMEQVSPSSSLNCTFPMCNIPASILNNSICFVLLIPENKIISYLNKRSFRSSDFFINLLSSRFHRRKKTNLKLQLITRI